MPAHHVLPKGDIFDHDVKGTSGSCTCGPRYHYVEAPDGRAFIAYQHISLIDRGPVPDLAWDFSNPNRPVPSFVPPAAGSEVPQFA